MIIGHLDADCFYVSAERVRNPLLHGVPVCVLGNHGACVIAKSYEAKHAGITTGMPIWEAQKICSDAVYIKRDFRWYEVLSRQLLAAVQQFSPSVEYYSIDEMFFVVRPCDLSAIPALQQSILQTLKIPVSIGAASTKILAKLCSDTAKPFGCRVLTTDTERQKLLAQLPVTEVTGIARRSAARLARHGITTCDQFIAADRTIIRRILHKPGEDLWWELQGTAALPLAPARAQHKVIARGGSIGRATRDPQRVQAFVVRNIERLVEALEHHNLYCDRLALSLSFRDAPEQSLRCSLLESTRLRSVLGETALWLLPQVWVPSSATVHYMHLIASGLRRPGERQRSLFPDPRLHPRQTTIEQTQSQINFKIGRFALRSAATLALQDVYADEAHSYDICDIYGKSCF